MRETRQAGTQIGETDRHLNNKSEFEVLIEAVFFVEVEIVCFLIKVWSC